MTHIRPVPVDTPTVYRLGLLLHSHLKLDGEHADVDLRGLSRSSARELLAKLEKTTGLVSGLMEIDSTPEEDADE